MNKIISILMERDNMSQKEAEELLTQTVQELDAQGWVDGDEIIMDYLGLEMDYIFDVISWSENRA